ncbi:MAG TPA: hypothetical protein VF632_11180 [Longimicrobium sp.]
MRNLRRLMWAARAIEVLRLSWYGVYLVFVLLSFVLDPWILYAGAAYSAVILFLGRVVIPRVRLRIRATAVALYASQSISPDQYDEACMRAQDALFRWRPGTGPPLPPQPF